MKALRYFGPGDIHCEGMDDPRLEADTDIIVKMNLCAICGSDLHIYHGHGFSEDTGYCVGHEAVGEVVETGRAVRRLRAGDRVMLPAATGCGACRQCLSGMVGKCENNMAGCYGLSAALQGCQAEAIRVPAGDFNAVPIPDGLSDEQALMLTDAMATAWFGARRAQIAPGGTVAVIGLGPIGLMAVESAFVMGASRVFAIDPVAARRALAAERGAEVFHPSDALEEIREATGGRKADSVIEAVGGDGTIDLALRLAGRGGTISAIGVAQTKRYAFPLERAFGQGLTFAIGTCSVPFELPALIPLVQSGRLKPETTISHRLSLSDGAEAYRLCDTKAEGALKVVMSA